MSAEWKETVLSVSSHDHKKSIDERVSHVVNEIVSLYGYGKDENIMQRIVRDEMQAAIAQSVEK